MKKMIALSCIACAIFVGCESKSDSSNGTESSSTTQILEDTKKAVNDATKATKDAVNNAVETTKEVTNDAVEATKKAATDTTEAVKEVANDTKEAATNAVDSTVKKAKKITQTQKASIDAKTLFVPCITCHGTKAEKKALNVSKVITTLSKDEIVTALKGYKNKTYGGSLKTTMYQQVSKLSDAQMEALANYILSLK